MNPEENNESSIERLKRTLYSRNESIVPKERRTPVSEHENNVPKDWGSQPSFGLSPDNLMTKPNNSFFNKFLLYSSLFFLAALGIAVFIFYGGLNMISSNNLDIKVIAPSSISSGEELLVDLSIVNSNRTDLENAVLYVDYPKGSQTVGQGSKPVARDTINLGTMASGAVSNYSFRTVLSGEKDVLKTFTFIIEYRVKGSDAVFSKEKSYDVVISSSPVLINVTYPKEVNSGQNITLIIDITSNSSTIMKNSLIKIEYPYGFTYKDSSIKPLSSNSVWNIGDLKNGDKKTLTITGSLIGQDLEDRTFNISLGTQSLENKTDFDTALATKEATVGIRKSFFNLLVSSVEPANIRVGQEIPITIGWQNTLPDKVIDGRIEVSLSGNVFDRYSVSVGSGGFYRSSDEKVIWDKSTLEALSTILSGDSGQVSFSVNSLDALITNGSIKNPHINVHVVVTGTRSGLDTSLVSSSQDITIKIPTTLGFTSKVFRAIGPFSNIGPIPPRADRETTYTVTWSLSNTSNDLKDAMVSAKLPLGMAWKSETSPSQEKISFDSNTSTISWNVGSISAGVGFGYAPRTVSFKVGLTPSLNQVGQSPNLLTDVNVTATDTYVEVPVSASVASVTTQYSDPSYKNGDNVVTK